MNDFMPSGSDGYLAEFDQFRNSFHSSENPWVDSSSAGFCDRIVTTKNSTKVPAWAKLPGFRKLFRASLQPGWWRSLNLLYMPLNSLILRSAGALACLFLGLVNGFSQTAFLNFNQVGQYTNNFSPWNDNGAGGNGGNYSFAESTVVGVGGTGGVSIFANNDTTAAYNATSWNFATNKSVIILSVMLNANGSVSGNRLQFGLLNSHANGLNSNPGAAFATYRFVPASATTWNLFEQTRSGDVTTTSASLGTVNVVSGRWYKFVIGFTNTSGITGDYSSSCALLDYGTTGTSPGANLINFATASAHSAQDIATNSAVWPALRGFANDGVGAWDNFTVFTTNQPPIITLPLANTSVTNASPATFAIVADGPGTLGYSWFTNGTRVAGAITNAYTIASVSSAYNSVSVNVTNVNGSVSSQASLTLSTNGNAGFTNLLPVAVTGYNRDVVIENTATGPPYNAYALEMNPGEGTAFYQHGLAGTTYGLPTAGIFTNANDGTIYQFQPYTGNNALVMSSGTGIANGTLTLVTPATYSKLAVLAHSGSATAASMGTLTIQFADGSSFVTNYNAFDWFFAAGFALQGVDRINLASGAAQGGPTDPRFYQTTYDLASLLGATNKPIASLTFGQAPGAGATAVYALSGLTAGQTNSFQLAAVTNQAATSITPTAASLNGQVLTTGGFAPTVTLFYGPANGGTNPAAWASSVSLGLQTASYSLALTNLNPSTTYYYAAQAVNIAGTNWATPSVSFTTQNASSPQVANAPATAIGATFATLNGQVLATGGLAANVTLYYGTADGGTNRANWASNLALGAQSGPFAQTINSLTPNTKYYFSASISNSLGSSWASPSLSFTTTATNPVSIQIPMLTYHNDNARRGANTNETQLTLANVNSASFGKLFSYAVDGYIYAQPLVMTNVAILGKGTHNLVIVVTEHESVYAFDADSNQGLNAAPLWKSSFINPAAGVTTVPNSETGTSDIVPEVGITATPVIDPATGTLYLEAKTKEVVNGTATYVHRLHALDLSTGLERTNGLVANSPVIIGVTNYPGTGSGANDNDGAGHVLFNNLKEHSRPALTLVNGVLLIAYASHGDNQPYHGWLFAYDAHSLAQLSVFNSTPNGGLGGFWQGGGGATVDENGYFYWMTGNGSFNATGATFGSTNNFAMSVLKFAMTNGAISLVDYFSPFDEAALSGADADLGSGAPLVLPPSVGSASHPRLLAAAGKGGKIYLLDRDNMGRFNAANDSRTVQVVTNALGSGGQNGSYMTPAFYNNTLYYIGMNNYLRAFPLSGGLISTATPVQSPTLYGDKGSSSPSISANGTSNAIVWVVESDAYASAGPAILHAYNATNVAQELYNSTQNSARDTLGGAVKFTLPTVVNGKVYAGNAYSLSVFGVAAFVPVPVISPAGGSFTSSTVVTISDASPSATIYYTLDGSLPTTNSFLYSAPFVLTNSAEVQAIAVQPGAVNSGVASAGFVNTSAIGSGTGLLAQYWSNTISIAFTNPAFAVLPSLTRTDAVVNFSLTNASPDPAVSTTNFVVRWTGAFQPQFDETYTLQTLSDAGVRLWVNGTLVLNQWGNQVPGAFSVALALAAQQRYNVQLEYFHGTTSNALAQLSWSSPSTPRQIIPQSQLYPVTNPPPALSLTNPVSGYTGTAAATITMSASAAAVYNRLVQVAFYTNQIFVGAVSNAPYDLTVPGLGAGSYTLTAIAMDGAGLTSTSAPVSFTINSGSGLPFGLTNLVANPAYFNLPNAFNGLNFAALPAKLSLTGVFTNTLAMTPYTGLIPMQPNSPLWSDGAVKTRYFAVPNHSGNPTAESQIGYSPTGFWTFPAGSVFVKTFELLTNQSDPNSLRRLETRLLVRDMNGAVYGVTYKWRPDNFEADLLTGSSNEVISLTTPAGVASQTWYYPSPADCLLCHTPQAGYVLGVNARQLNGNQTYPNGVTDNELRTLNRLGLLHPALDESALGGVPKLFSLTNQSASFEQRARSYLDSNCSQCHLPGGSGPTFDGRFDTPLTNQNLIYGILAKGDLGYDNAYVVKPNDIYRSLLYDRMNSTNEDFKMPDLARNLIDTNAVQLFAQWIKSLPGTPTIDPPVIVPNGGSIVGSALVTLQPPDPSATLYYTLDGSIPTTNSLLYSGPFPLTRTATLRANAFETGFNNSVAASALFNVQTNLLFSAPVLLSSGIFQVQFTGATNHSYVLQTSTNLLTWFSLNTNVPAASPFTLTDPTASNSPTRFYRVLQLP